MGTKTALRKIDARYGAMTLFANDTGAVTRSLLLYREWAQREIEFITSLFEPGATVLDVGAYVGTHTLAFADRVGPAGRVLSFEAQPCSFKLLERNVAANGLSQVRLHHEAVSDVSCTIKFAPIDPSRKESFGSASLTEVLRGRASAPTTGSTVATTTIDALDLDRCDFAKIDVEDSEDLVLRGTTRTIERCRPIIYAECNSVDAGVRIVELLRSHGYELRLHLAPAFNPANFAGEQQNIFGAAREAAILGVPPDSPVFRERQMAPSEMLFAIQTVDDLVLGLLNKPQYIGEMLIKTPAAQFAGQVSIERVKNLFANAQSPTGPNEFQDVNKRGETAALDSAQALAIAELETRLHATHAALDGAQELAAARQVELARLTDRVDITQTALDSAQGLAKAREVKIAELERRLHAMQIALEREQELAARHRVELARLTQRLEEAQIALESAEARAVEYERAADAARAKANAALLQASLARRSADTALVRAERIATGHKVELEQMRIALEEAKATATAILNSTSWRWTAPVRRLERLVRWR